MHKEAQMYKAVADLVLGGDACLQYMKDAREISGIAAREIREELQKAAEADPERRAEYDSLSWYVARDEARMVARIDEAIAIWEVMKMYAEISAEAMGSDNDDDNGPDAA